MDTFLDTEFGHQHVEGSVQDPDNSSLSDNGTILVGQVRDEHGEIQMGGLLLREPSTLLLTVGVRVLGTVQNLGWRITIHVTLLSNLGNSIAVQGKLGFCEVGKLADQRWP